ncbi:hypothetical protein IWQ47_002593 [Aquimarina sp. EL_43]|uniref:hypothetical protein n=1 Tax=Aquimarina TaxID=290174 RepID=UPI000472534F|nr:MULTISPECIES: hypothetical protein [Aquimarina]MBG6131123.1 hypothetical protein [Aquimarina sp. EL_35]MBG6151582.1 hypothetical protein [Aquimarina sp. EL_32]MBG6169513.1 hypothetical protein [Aquimarina sp. EL_43]
MKTTNKNKVFVSCEEAKHICDKNQYGEASFLEIIKLNIRLIYCKVTRAYSKRNTKLTKTINNSKTQSISASDKEAMKKEITKRIN